jgi:hypothetical protein
LSGLPFRESAGVQVRLLQGKLRVDEARQELSEIYAWFTEGFETPDLRQAEALLDDLTAPR